MPDAQQAIVFLIAVLDKANPYFNTSHPQTRVRQGSEGVGPCGLFT